VVDFSPGGNDLLLENTNLLINGEADSFVIFRIPDEANFLVSQANIIVGNNGRSREIGVLLNLPRDRGSIPSESRRAVVEASTDSAVARRS
jgi:hypothetical protein